MASKDNYSWDHNHLFVNPYNFVSSDFSKGESINAADEKKECTGVLKCRMITKTPVALPGDVIKPGFKKHKTYDFFHYEDGSYAIPGSSVRGAVRSVYEAITDSCYVTAKEDALITKRSSKAHKPSIGARTKEGRKLYPPTSYIDMLHEKKPCKNRNKLCKACALFGMATDEKIGSRVRFSDAIIKKENITNMNQGCLPKMILAELASPKPSYLPFYLKEPGDSKEEIYNYGSDKAQLRGRKFYWHHAPKKGPTPERTERNATMEVIESNREGFKFNVYYDNISQEQLKELIWSLTLGENDENSKFCYKIGHGKPIGLGSVKIVIDEQIERCFGDDYEAVSNSIKEVEDVFKNSTIKRELLHITNIDALKGKDVRYPYVQGQSGPKDNKRAAHQWFGRNYKLGDSKPEYYLPEISKDGSLPSANYKEPDFNRNGNDKPRKYR